MLWVSGKKPKYSFLNDLIYLCSKCTDKSGQIKDYFQILIDEYIIEEKDIQEGGIYEN